MKHFGVCLTIMISGCKGKLKIGWVVMFHTSDGMGQDQITITSKIWEVRFYIINVRFARKKLDNRPNCSYLMIYASTTGVIIY